MAVIVLNNGDPQFSIPAGGTGTHKIYGSDGADKLAIATGAKAQLVSGFAQSTDVVYFQGDSTNYTTSVSGSTVTFTDKSGGSIKVAANPTGQSLVFGDGSAILKINTGTGTITLGSGATGTTAQTITATPTTVAAPVDTTNQSDAQFGGTTPTPTGAYTLTAAGNATSVNEGSSLTYTITAATAPTADTTFTWAISASSSATAGDFTGATSGTATIKANATTATFSVTPLADNVAEFSENFIIDVKDSNGTAITKSPITTSINDVTVDVVAPVVTAAQTFSYAENQTTAGTTLGTVAATDATGVTGYSIATVDGVAPTAGSELFAIDATGKLSLTAAGIAAGAKTNDYETTPNTFTLGVVASDAAGNKSTATNVTVNVTNVDDDPPVLSTATGNSTSIVLAYSEALDTGSIPSKTDFYVTQTVTGGATTVIDVSSVSMTTSSITLALGASVTSGATVKVSYTPGTKPIQDAKGYDAVALTNQTVTTDTTAPTLASSSPADNATTMAVGDNVTMTFSETVLAGTGSIKLYKADGTLVETFNVATGAGDKSGTVAFSGTTATINPGSDLTAAANYYINVDATAVKDSIGNLYAGISNTTTLNFGTTGSAGTTGKTVTLTQSADTVSTTQTNASFQTGDGDDAINGLLDSGAATFSPTLDNINGGGGTDTLVAYGQQGANNLTNVAAVEKFTFRTGAAASFDMSTTSGYTYLTNEGSTHELDFLKISSTSPYLVVNGATSDTGFIHSATALQGASDSVNFQVTGYVPGQGATAAVSEGLVLNSGIETLNFASSTSASSFGLWTDDNGDGTSSGNEGATATDTQGYASATTLAVTGNANLDLTGGLYAAHPFTGLKTVGANGFTGNLTLSLVGNTNAVTVTGGDGNDTVTFTGTTISKATGNADSVNLGVGVMDTLGVAGALATGTANYGAFVAAVNAVVSNTEALLFFDTNINTGSENTSITASAYTNGIKYFAFNDPTYTAGVNTLPTIAIDGLASTNAMIFNENLVGASGAAAGDEAVKLSASAAGQTANVTLGGATLTGGSGFLGANNVGARAINGATGFSTLVITSNTDSASNTNTLAGGTGAGTKTDSAALTGFSNVQLKGDTEITIRGLTEGFTDAVSFDAASFTAKSTVFLENDGTTGDIFTGGSGADNVYGLGGADNLSGNVGNDALYGGGGKDTLSGGDGDDTLVSGDFPTAAAAATADSLTGGNGTDAFYIAQAQQGATAAVITANTYTIADFNASGEKIYLSAAGTADPTAGRQLMGSTALADLTWNAATGVSGANGKVINIGTLAKDTGSTVVEDLDAMLVNATLTAGKISVDVNTNFIVVFNSARDNTTYAAIIDNDGTADIALGTDAVTLIKLPNVTVADLSAADFSISYTAEVAPGVTVAGTANADFLTGTPFADTINANLAAAAAGGADSIRGGAGNDTINITNNTDDVKIVHYGNASDGVDTVTGFVGGGTEDILVVLSNLITGTAGEGKDTSGNAGTYAASAVETVNDAAAATNTDKVIWKCTEQIAASTASTAVANAVIQLTDTADFAANMSAGEGGLVIMNDGTNTFVFEYKADAAAATTTTAADLTLIGIFDLSLYTNAHTDNFA